jgi:hypothetical protein
VNSGLSGVVSKDGVTVRVDIYRLEEDTTWMLEVVNEAGTSTVWDDQFASDGEALAAFHQAVAEEGMQAFLDSAKVIPFRPRK